MKKLLNLAIAVILTLTPAGNVLAAQSSGENQPPVAVDDYISVQRDGTVSFNVLTNDSDPEGDYFYLVGYSGESLDGLSYNGNGNFTYQPPSAFTGSKYFNYFINDTSNAQDMGAIFVNVYRPNTAPVANADSATVDNESSVTFDVLANDTDADGDTLRLDAWSYSPSKGSFTRDYTKAGVFTFQPTAGFTGIATLDYQVSDGFGGTANSRVTITVSQANRAPVANNDTFSGDEDTALTGNVLLNDTDIDGDTLAASIVTQAQNGTVTLNNDGTFTYTPNANFNGTDSFSYSASDGQASSTATVNLTVEAVNDAPSATNDAFSTDEDSSVSGNVLTNDSDLDGDSLTASLVTQAQNGTVTLNSDGSFTYTPNANYHGADSFTYSATDGALTSTATVALSVGSINDAPTATNDAFTLAEDSNVSGNVLTNDSDLDGDSLTASLVAGTQNGTVTLNSDGTFTYTPNANYNGTDSFTYSATDGELTSTATVNLTVNSVNDGPVANFTTSKHDRREYLLNASSSYDIDGTIASYHWNFGDGSTLTTTSSSTIHNYSQQGTFTATLTITDNDGSQSTISKTFEVTSKKN